MSFLTTQPEFMVAASGELQAIGSALSARNASAAVSTQVTAPAADAVSVLTAGRFNTHAAQYQAVSARAAAIHQMFVETLRSNAGSYAATEAANAAAAG